MSWHYWHTEKWCANWEITCSITAPFSTVDGFGIFAPNLAPVLGFVKIVILCVFKIDDTQLFYLMLTVIYCVLFTGRNLQTLWTEFRFFAYSLLAIFCYEIYFHLLCGTNILYIFTLFYSITFTLYRTHHNEKRAISEQHTCKQRQREREELSVQCYITNALTYLWSVYLWSHFIITHMHSWSRESKWLYCKYSDVVNKIRFFEIFKSYLYWQLCSNNFS